MLNTDVERFDSEGLLLFPPMFLDRDEVDAMQYSLDVGVRAGFLDRDQYYGEPHTKEVFWAGGLPAIRIYSMAVEAVLGPNLILVYSSMFIKLPDDRTSVGWHQDNNYWAQRPRHRCGHSVAGA